MVTQTTYVHLSIVNIVCTDIFLQKYIFRCLGRKTCLGVQLDISVEASAKLPQHFNAIYRNIVGPACGSPGQTIATFRLNIFARNMLRAFGQTVTAFCDMLGVVNRTVERALAQHCYKKLAKRIQHHVTSTHVA